MMNPDDEPKITSEVVGRMVDQVLGRAGGLGGVPIEEVINETLYHENQRLADGGHSASQDEADRAFYRRVRQELPHASTSRQQRLLHKIVERYAREICGHFDPRVYQLTSRLAPLGLNALLNGLSPLKLLGRLSDLPTLEEHIIVQGEVETLKKLHEMGTIILVPTHSSNLDSVVLGYAVEQLGLPPFTYGAGLNLFSNPIVGRFISRMGAYSVDRLKTDPLYRETLKEYATVTLEFGRDTLFFPGGTRSRSGALERHLKKGLLGTSLAAYRGNLKNKRPHPNIYVVPCTISYPLVLEAATLIDDYLKEAGKARYIIVDDEFSRWQRWLDFARGLFALDLRIYITISKPLDPFGDDVDEEGRSLDPRGRVIDPSGYLLADGELAADPVRDAEYTSGLSERLVATYGADNVALPTNVVAFAMFDLLWRQRKATDLYRFLRTLGPETSVPLPEFEQHLEHLVGELSELASAGRIRLSRTVGSRDIGEIVRRALRSFGIYHTTPVIERRGIRLHVGDANLMFYYRNRLEGYGLLDSPRLVRGGRRRP